jgi:DNA-binding MarR family transcriptional regulator
MSQLSLAELMAEISRRSTDEFDVLRQHMDTLQVVHQLKLQSAVGDKTDWETMRLIREMVAKHKEEMSAWEVALLACWHLSLSGAEEFNARQVNSLLTELSYKTTNITSVMDSLKSRGGVDSTGPDALGKHKNYILTPQGREDARKLLQLPRLLTKVG